MHAVDREVAGEHAPVGAEAVEAVFDPGPESGDLHRAHGHRQPRQLAVHVGSERGQSRHAGFPGLPLLVGVVPGPAGVLDHDGQIVESRQCLRGVEQPVGMGHDVENEIAVAQLPQNLLAGNAGVEGRGPDPTEAAGRHLGVDHGDDLGDGLRGPDAADDRGGVAGGFGQLLPLEGLGDVERSRGRSHVYELLDVPARRLGEVGVEVEPPRHARDIAHVELATARQIGVPVGTRRVPQVYVRVDDAGDGCVGHRVSFLSADRDRELAGIGRSFGGTS